MLSTKAMLRGRGQSCHVAMCSKGVQESGDSACRCTCSKPAIPAMIWATSSAAAVAAPELSAPSSCSSMPPARLAVPVAMIMKVAAQDNVTQDFPTSPAGWLGLIITHYRAAQRSCALDGRGSDSKTRNMLYRTLGQFKDNKPQLLPYTCKRMHMPRPGAWRISIPAVSAQAPWLRCALHCETCMLPTGAVESFCPQQQTPLWALMLHLVGGCSSAHNACLQNGMRNPIFLEKPISLDSYHTGLPCCGFTVPDVPPSM